MTQKLYSRLCRPT